MTITFKDSFNDTVKFTVYSVSCSYLNGEPIDIGIIADEETLDNIAENFGILGYNSKETDNLTAISLGFTHEALYGRLKHFELENIGHLNATMNLTIEDNNQEEWTDL